MKKCTTKNNSPNDKLQHESKSDRGRNCGIQFSSVKSDGQRELIKFLNGDGQYFQDLRNQNQQCALYFVVSYGNEAQTKENFAYFVSWLNANQDIISKLTIVDTAYLNRHCNEEYEVYADTGKLTPWEQENLAAIQSIKIPCIVEKWPEYLRRGNFSTNDEIVRSAFGNMEAAGSDPRFHGIVLEEAQKHFKEGKGTLNGCIEYILEECAQYPLLNESVIVYSGGSSRAMKYAEKNLFKLNIDRIFYQIPELERKKRQKEGIKHSGFFGGGYCYRGDTLCEVKLNLSGDDGKNVYICVHFGPVSTGQVSEFLDRLNGLVKSAQQEADELRRPSAPTSMNM